MRAEQPLAANRINNSGRKREGSEARLSAGFVMQRIHYDTEPRSVIAELDSKNYF
jgi:hypothetical protein